MKVVNLHLKSNKEEINPNIIQEVSQKLKDNYDFELNYHDVCHDAPNEIQSTFLVKEYETQFVSQFQTEIEKLGYEMVSNSISDGYLFSKLIVFPTNRNYTPKWYSLLAELDRAARYIGHDPDSLVKLFRGKFIYRAKHIAVALYYKDNTLIIEAVYPAQKGLKGKINMTLFSEFTCHPSFLVEKVIVPKSVDLFGDLIHVDTPTSDQMDKTGMCDKLIKHFQWCMSNRPRQFLHEMGDEFINLYIG